MVSIQRHTLTFVDYLASERERCITWLSTNIYYTQCLSIKVQKKQNNQTHRPKVDTALMRHGISISISLAEEFTVSDHFWT